MALHLPEKSTMLLLLMILIFSGCSIMYITSVITGAIEVQTQDELGTIAETIAIQTNGDSIAALQPGDENTPEFIAIRNALYELEKALPNIRNIYILRKAGESVVFVVDAEFGISPDAAAIGRRYPRVTQELMQGFERVSVDKSATTDKRGTFLSGYSPVLDSRGAIVGIVGVDMDQKDVIARKNLINWTSYMIVFLAILMAVFGIICIEREREKSVLDLRDREARYRTLFETTYDAILILKEGMISDCNARATQLFCGTKEQLIGKNILDLAPEMQSDGTKSYETGQDMMQRALAGETVFYERKLRTLDNTEFDAETRLIKIEVDRVTALQMIIRDITERKRAEDALKANEIYLKMIFDSVQTGLVIIDPATHTILDVNPIAARMIGDTRDRIIGSVCHKFICPADKGKCPITDLGQQVDNAERILITAHGDRIPIIKYVTPITLHGRNLLLESFLDISTRKRAEQALQESEEKYRILTETSPDAIYIIDKNHNTVYANRFASTLFDQGLSTLIGKKLPDPSQQEPAQYQHGIIDEVLQRGATLTREDKIIARNGSEIWLDSFFSPLKNEAGETMAVMSVSHDITERKLLENTISASLKEKEFLLKEIHHRVKNNLQVIASLLSMQEKKATDPNVKGSLMDSQNRVKSIALVHEKLYQSKSLDQVDYSDYLNKITNYLFEVYNVNRAQIICTVNAENVYVDINQAVPCSLILNEMITNSLKYAFPGERKGAITIDFVADGTNYILKYHDNGIGIPEGVTFERAESLGMQLINGLTRQIDGTVELQRGDGTTFIIKFPHKQKNR